MSPRVVRVCPLSGRRALKDYLDTLSAGLYDMEGVGLSLKAAYSQNRERRVWIKSVQGVGVNEQEQKPITGWVGTYLVFPIGQNLGSLNDERGQGVNANFST